MSWFNVRLRVAARLARTAEHALSTTGAEATSQENAAATGDAPALLGEAPQWDTVVVSGLFASDTDLVTVAARLNALLGDGLAGFQVEPVAEQDWVRAWLGQFEPFQVGRRMWVCPSWRTPPEADAINIILDPGMAFGTGTHATTALCLDAVSRMSMAGLEVVDIGCGSGILAIAALLAGAREAWGIDIDPHALTTSRANAARNGVAARYHASLPDQLSGPVRGDLVFANILADTLVALAGDIDQRVKPGGRLILSGILIGQQQRVARHYRRHYRFEQVRKDDWLALVGTRTDAEDKTR